MSSFTISFSPLVSSGGGQLPGTDSPAPSPVTYAGGNNTIYHTYWEMMVEMQNIAANYSSIAQLTSIGQSWQGRDLWAMKISDNVAVDENEPEVYFNGCHHAREWLTIEINLYFINWITGNYSSNLTAQYLVNNREIWVVPLVNPDGREYDGSTLGDDPINHTQPPVGGIYGWRKNLRDNNGGGFSDAIDGVDLNRNYGWHWGSEPNIYSEDTYGGPYAFSEPETLAIKQFVENRSFVTSISYHTYSQLVMWPAGWTYEAAPDNTLMTALGYAISNNITNLAGSAYPGYTPEPSNQLYTTSGDDVDWLYGEMGIYSYVIEAYPNVNDDDAAVTGIYDLFHPRTDKVIPACQDNLGGMICCALIADNPNQVMDHITLTPEPSSLLINQGTNDDFTINALNDGKRNDNFDISHSSITGWTIATPASVSLDRNQSQNFTLNVTVPVGYAGGDYTIWVNATSQLNSTCKYGTTVMVTVPFYHDVALSSHTPFQELGQHPQGDITMSAVSANKGQVSEEPFNLTCTVGKLGTSSTYTVFSDGFESGMTKWTLYDHDQTVSTNYWHQVTQPHAGTYGCWCGPTGTTVTQYSNNVIQSMETATPINLRNASGANLTFWARYNIEENYDYGKIEVSGDGGANWALLARYTGTQTAYSSKTINLGNFTGSQNVLIRFFFTSDPGSTAAGWRVDDISVTAEYMSETIVYGPTNALTSGTLTQNGTQECTWQYSFTPGKYRASFQTNLSTDERSNNNLKDVVFTIDSATLPAVAVTQPNTALTWTAGSSQTITWTASAGSYPLASNPMSIYYSPNGPGGPWSLLAGGEANDGAFTWLVNNTASTNCYVRVDAQDNQGFIGSDSSDVAFTIQTTPMNVWVISPNGGECMWGGGSWPITWVATPGGYPFKAWPITIEYSTNGSSGPWSLIASNEDNDGTYAWSPVPTLDVSTCYIRITAEDTSGGTGQDLSNSSFLIDSVWPAPATNFRAELTGTNDITLYWTASPDSDVAYYQIWTLLGSWDPTGNNYTTLVYNASNTNTSYTHGAQGNNSGNQYCYQLRTFDYAGHETRTIVQAAKFSKLVSYPANTAWSTGNGGWILLGSSLEQSSYAVSYKLQGVGLGYNGNYNWTAVQMYNPWDTADPWKTNVRNATTSQNDIASINNTQGFWLCVHNGIRYASAGKVSNISISLKAGWNLVPYPLITTQTTSALRDHLMANCPGFSGSYNDMQIFRNNKDGLAPYRTFTPTGTEFLNRQEAFWMCVPFDTVWTVNYYAS